MIHVKRITLIVKLKLKTSMWRSSLCDYSDAYILVSETITIAGAGDDDDAKRVDETNKR